MRLVNDVAWFAYDVWAWPVLLLSMAPKRLSGSWLHRWIKAVCPLAPPAWVVAVATDHLGWLWLLAVLAPPWWWYCHRTYCKDQHGRKLRDAANGVVHRIGNRLTVKPVGASS